jgi:predicted nucleic acid-binding protein
MPRALPEVLAGTALLLDANIFIYAFTGESRQCARLIERCRNEELLGVTTSEVIGEVCHRLMIREAVETGLVARPIVGSLKSKPETVKALRTYWELTGGIFQSNLLLLSSIEERHFRAQSVRSEYGLLTNDSLLVASALEYGIEVLATRDADFDRISELTVYRPTDIP